MPRADVTMTEDEIRRFLALPQTGVFATLGRDGSPHLSGMWFVPAPDSLRMWTYGKSQKAVNARRDPRGSFLVEQGEAYTALRGVSLTGHITVLEGFEDVRAIGVDLYARYTEPRLGIPIEDGPIVEIERQARKRVGLVLRIESIASWDHSKLS
jgi:PPOX class probable F420-dependent enzyme